MINVQSLIVFLGPNITRAFWTFLNYQLLIEFSSITQHHICHVSTSFPQVSSNNNGFLAANSPWMWVTSMRKICQMPGREEAQPLFPSSFVGSKVEARMFPATYVSGWWRSIGFLGPKTELEANDYIMSLELHLSDFEDIHLNDSKCFINGYTTPIRIWFIFVHWSLFVIRHLCMVFLAFRHVPLDDPAAVEVQGWISRAPGSCRGILEKKRVRCGVFY